MAENPRQHEQVLNKCSQNKDHFTYASKEVELFSFGFFFEKIEDIQKTFRNQLIFTEIGATYI